MKHTYFATKHIPLHTVSIGILTESDVGQDSTAIYSCGEGIGVIDEHVSLEQAKEFVNDKNKALLGKLGQVIANNEVEDKYLKTLIEIHQRGVNLIWTGELRNKYVHDCLSWAIESEILELTEFDSAVNQESNLIIKWF